MTDALISQVLAAILIVESGGDCSKVGDNGRARGPYQMHYAAWCEAEAYARRRGIPFVVADWNIGAHDRLDALCRAHWYLKKWGEHYERTTGKKATAEVLSRLYNGGPTGWRKRSTLAYWRKVKKEMESQK